MKPKIVSIKSVIRPMRGGSQSHLVEGQDGCFYVVKFANNPQGHRTLINEWIVSALLQRLFISTPHVQVLRLTERVRDAAQLSFSVGHRQVPIESGLHFGSACPVNPNTTAIFDYLPRNCLRHVVNLGDFARALVIDKWLGNLDSRQAIFARAPGSSRKAAFRAYLIDHGLVLGGSQWELNAGPLAGLCYDQSIYNLLEMPLLCQETIDHVQQISLAEIEQIVRTVPSTWFKEEDRAELDNLLVQVDRRRTRLRSILASDLKSLAVPIIEPEQESESQSSYRPEAVLLAAL